MKVVGFIVAGISIAVSLPSYAHDYPNQNTSCYQFKANQLLKKQACTIIQSGGAGGDYTAFEMGKKTYEFESSYRYLEKQDDYDVEVNFRQQKGNRLIYTPAEFYYRDDKTLKKTNSYASDDLHCYIVPSKQLDICYDGN